MRCGFAAGGFGVFTLLSPDAPPVGTENFARITSLLPTSCAFAWVTERVSGTRTTSKATNKMPFAFVVIGSFLFANSDAKN